MSEKIHVLWFDSKGCGPDQFHLQLKPMPPDEGRPANLGLMVRAGELVILGRPMINGGFLVHRTQVAELHRQMGEWLEANPEAPLKDELDPREERVLTSRECAKIIGSVIGGLLYAGIPSADLHNGLRAIQAVVGGGIPQKGVLGPEDEQWCAALGGIIGGLTQWCRIQDVQTAITWIFEHWMALVGPPARRGAV